MAALHPDSLRSEIRSHTVATIEAVASQLPGGACNFRELARGTKSPVCGCKRFWLNNTTATADPSNPDNAWCFCRHHACFHNAVSQQSQRLSTQIPSSHQPSPHPKPVRGTPEGYVSLQNAATLPVPAGLGIQSQSQSINTRVWEALNGFARQQEAQPYSGRTSQLPSTAVSVINEPQKPARIMGPPVHISPTAVTRPGADDFPGSATEVATPSIAGTPDPQAFVPPGSQTRFSPKTTSFHHGGSLTRDQANKSHSIKAATPSQEILNLIRAHANRLDALESLSFSHVPIEDVHDRFELFDGRLLDLEQWRAETEHHQLADVKEQGSRKRRLLPAEVASFASDESFDVTAAAHAEAAVLATIATNAEIGPRIDMLESRVNDLERSALPSFSNPWQVQVVLLPWGRNLRGIWFPSMDAAQHSMHTSLVDTDEWTGAQSQVKTSFRSSSSDAWTTESIQAWAESAQDWLSPKACGPSGTVYQRLASRGMIRDVTISATDSRHILDVLATTFKHILPAASKDLPNGTQYQGLQSAFLPLRKVRKSTRLRFLSHAEMITSATWTASFLESSVLMKVGDGQRRLYITTPEAYLQHDDGTSWSQIRQLPVRDVNGNEQAGQVDSSIAIEACWSYNDKIDHVPSLHSSFESYVSHAAWSTKSQQSYQNEGHGQLTPALSGAEQSHKRSNSFPSSASVHEPVELPQRRVASFGHASAAPSGLKLFTESTKRRRLSNSQEAERRGVNFTPRWSREPPSPYHSEHAAEARSQGASSSRKRGNTPFAYATPHSNNHYTNPMDLLGDADMLNSNNHLTSPMDATGDGDTERDSQSGDEDDEEEEEWNGMDAAAETPAVQDIYTDEDDDDEDMDEQDMP